MLERTAVALAMILFFVWSLPGVTALRSLLLFSALLLLANLIEWRSVVAAARANRWPLGLLGLLSAWLMAQAIFVSPETAWALGELKGQWGNALFAGALGLLLAMAVRKGGFSLASWVTTLLAGVLILQAAIAVGQSLFSWLAHSELRIGSVPLTGGKLEMSYILNILLATIAVDLLFRATHKRGFLRLPLHAVVLALMLALLSTYLAGARNGILGVLFLSFSALTLYLIETQRQHGARRTFAAGAILLTLVVGFAGVSYHSDARWRTFVETATIAWDIDESLAWRDSHRYPFPRLANGDLIDSSAYVRVAFIHAGLREIGKHPLGVGYGRNAFVHALRQTEDAQVGHAHSGWIDLGVGGGIPALVLWAAFLASLLITGAIRYFRDDDPHALWLFLLTTGYAGRMVLDSVNRDHMLQMFFFLGLYLLAMSLPPNDEGLTAPAKGLE